MRNLTVRQIEDGKEVRGGNRIFAGPDSEESSTPGATVRRWYYLGILVLLALLVYLIRISLD